MSDENSYSVDFAGIADGHAPVMANVPAQTPKDEYLSGRIKDLFQAADTANIGRTLNMNLFLAAQNGDAFMAIDNDTGAIYRVLDGNEYAASNNRMINNHRALWGKLTHAKPQFIVTPGPNASLDQIYGSRACEGFLKHLQNNSDIEEVISLCKKDASWSYNGGVAFMRWNPLGGSSYCLCAQCGYKDEGEDLTDIPCPMCEQQATMQREMLSMADPQMPAQGMPGQMQSPSQLGTVGTGPAEAIETPLMICLKRGTPEIEQIDPRNLFLQPGIRNKKTMQWFLIRQPCPVQEVRTKFPHKALEISAESDVYPSHGAMYTIDNNGTQVNERLRDHVYLYIFVERGSNLYPNGRVIYMANSRVIHVEEAGWKDLGRFPLFQWGWLPIENTPYFRPPAADAWDGQREFNRLETHQSLNSAIVAHANLIVPFGSGVGADERTAITGQTLYPIPQHAEKLRWLEPPRLSPDVYQRSERVDMSIMEHYGITPQEGGQQTSDPNGRFAAIQEAESDQSVAPIREMHDAETAALYKAYLIYVQLYGDPDEKFNVLSRMSQELFSFQDLKLAFGCNQIALVPSTGLAGNPALKRADALQLANMNFFGMPGTPDFKFDLFADFAGIKVPGLVPDMTDGQIQNAVAALKMIEDGYQFVPMVWDDAEKFVTVFNDWLVYNGRRYAQTGKFQIVEIVLRTQDFYKQLVYMAEQAALAQEAAVGAQPGQPSGQQATRPGGNRPSAPGQQATAPGGTPNKSVADQAGQTIKQADRAAESAVRGSSPREG